jgi:hypothetical protein
VTVALGAGSILGTLISLVAGVPANVRRALSDTIRLQTIITGCDRQISLLETTAFRALGHGGADMAEVNAFVLQVQVQIAAVVKDAVAEIAQVTTA